MESNKLVNWYALIFGPIWGIYHGCYKFSAVWTCLFIVILALSKVLLLVAADCGLTVTSVIIECVISFPIVICLLVLMWLTTKIESTKE